MSTRWFYSRAGKTHGPLSAEEIKALAAQGKITETDLVWPEGSGPDEALPAQAALAIEQAAGGELPDWLEDVKSATRTGPLPPPEPTHELPEWLDDLRVWMALDASDPAIPWDHSLGVPPLQQEISNAVETWFPESLTQEPASTAPTPAAKPEAAVAPAATAPLVPPAAGPVVDPTTPPATTRPAAPIPKPTVKPPSKPAPPVAQPAEPAPRTPMASSGVPAPPATPQKPVIPLAKPVEPCPSPPAAPRKPAEIPLPRPVAAAQKPAPPSPTARKATDLVAEQAIRESGFDPRTGEIRDLARFGHWKQQKAQAAAQGSCTNAGLMEVFRKARTEIEQWLDRESNRPLVLALDVEAIRKDPEIRAVIQRYDGYGPTFRDKLLRHLAFMAENRSKYYRVRPQG